MSDRVTAPVRASATSAASRAASLNDDDDVITPPSAPRRSGRASPRSRARIQRSRGNGTNGTDQKTADLLNKNGFEVTENLLVTDEDGNTRVATVKVVNCLGQTAFVDIDDQNVRMATTPKDLTLIEVHSKAVISESDRGNYQVAGNDVAGVALDCGNGICTLTNDEDPREPRERNFVYVASNHTRTGVVDGNTPIAYPVVRLSEIIANPQLCIKNINEATCRIRERVRAAVMEQLAAPADESVKDCESGEVKMSMRAAIKSASEEYDKFLHVLNDRMKKTQSTICQLEAFQRHYVVKPPCEEEEVLKMRAMSVLLRRWNQMYVDELRAAMVVNEKKNAVLAVKEDIAALTTYIDDNYNNVAAEMGKLCIAKEVAKKC